MSETYDFAAIESKWQKAWLDADAFAVREEPGKPEVLLPGDVPLPLRPHPHGPRPQLQHRRCHRPLQMR